VETALDPPGHRQAATDYFKFNVKYQRSERRTSSYQEGVFELGHVYVRSSGISLLSHDNSKVAVAKDLVTESAVA